MKTVLISLFLVGLASASHADEQNPLFTLESATAAQFIIAQTVNSKADTGMDDVDAEVTLDNTKSKPDNAKNRSELYRIAPDTVECQGVAKQRCLVVNGEYFYDVIEGYEHVEGEAAEILVERIYSPEGHYLYRMVGPAMRLD